MKLTNDQIMYVYGKLINDERLEAHHILHILHTLPLIRAPHDKGILVRSSYIGVHIESLGVLPNERVTVTELKFNSFSCQLEVVGEGIIACSEFLTKENVGKLEWHIDRAKYSLSEIQTLLSR